MPPAPCSCWPLKQRQLKGTTITTIMITTITSSTTTTATSITTTTATTTSTTTTSTSTRPLTVSSTPARRPAFARQTLQRQLRTIGVPEVPLQGEFEM